MAKVNSKTNSSSENQGDPFYFLKLTNDWLESVPSKITSAFDNFSNLENMTQEKVDSICTWLSWKINIQIERIRQKVIKSIWGMYKDTAVGKVMQVVMVGKNFISDPLGTLSSFASSIFSPIGATLSWLTTLVQELPRLAKNLANIVSSLPPPSPNPDINFNKFKIKVKTIDLQTVTTNPDNLPSPEVMFPEPPKPFSKETFDDTFANASAKLKSNKVVYKLTEKQKRSLQILSGDDLSKSAFDDLTFNA